MNRLWVGIICLLTVVYMTACKDDAANAGSSVLDADDAIIVLADTFPVRSAIDSYQSIVSQTDSFLLGEIETDYGLMCASLMTQLACPEGYAYPDGAVFDSICLFMYYSSWVGDGYSPLALNAYLMDRKTFNYSERYTTDISIDDYCSRTKSILVNHRIVVASEKLDSVADSNGKYVPMLCMRLNDDFTNAFTSIRSFDSQEAFNKQFYGLLLETSFGSSTVLNISDVALGVYYHFSYNKAGRDTTVSDMKAFYANSEVRTINHIEYRDKSEWVDSLQRDSNSYNYIIAPAGVYTRMTFPMGHMAEAIMGKLVVDSAMDEGTMKYKYKNAYVNLAQVRVDVTNVFSGSSSEIQRNDWLQPAGYMLLIREESMERFFAEKELPSDTCALLSLLTQGTDSAGNSIYYYSYDISDLLTRQLRMMRTKQEVVSDEELKMLLVPVTVTTASTSSTSITSVKPQQTLSATQIRSAKNGMTLKLVYSGF